MNLICIISIFIRTSCQDDVFRKRKYEIISMMKSRILEESYTIPFDSERSPSSASFLSVVFAVALIIQPLEQTTVCTGTGADIMWMRFELSSKLNYNINYSTGKYE